MAIKPKPLKESKIENILEKIAEDTVKEIFSLPKGSRPKHICLKGTSSEQLANVMGLIKNKLYKKIPDYHPSIYLEQPIRQKDYLKPTPYKKEYSIDVGYYLRGD